MWAHNCNILWKSVVHLENHSFHSWLTYAANFSDEGENLCSKVEYP